MEYPHLIIETRHLTVALKLNDDFTHSPEEEIENFQKSIEQISKYLLKNAENVIHYEVEDPYDEAISTLVLRIDK